MLEVFKDKKKLLVNIVIVLCYAIFTFFIVLHHEIWEDEAQVWLFAKNLSLPELFKHLFSEGHPPLFYLLVFPFAKLGLGVFSMQILCWLASCVGVFLLFHYSPFKWWLNTSIVLSCGFLYAFPVIARSYSILPFLVFLSAILYQKRKEQPVLYSLSLFLISMTHVIMLPFVFVLFILFLFETLKEKRLNYKTVLSSFLLFLGIFYVLLLSFSAVSRNHFINYHPDINFYTPLIFLMKFFSSALFEWSKISMNCVYAYIISFLILLAEIFRFSPKAFFIAFFSVLGQFLIYVLFYFSPVYQTRIFSMFLIIVFSYWICWKKCEDKVLKHNISLLLSLFFILTIFNGIKYINDDYFGAYSGSKETAAYIEKNIPKNTLILTDVAQTSVSVLSYLKAHKLLYVPSDEIIKYAIWDKNTQDGFSQKQWSAYLSDKKGDVWLLLVDEKYIDNSQILFVSPSSVAKKEKFYLLKYKGKENE